MLTLLSLLAVLPAHATAGTAEISVEELLKLHAAQQGPDEEAPKAPPVAGALEVVRLEGRVLGETIALEGAVRLSVLADEVWTSVPVMKLSPELEITELPEISDGLLTIDGDTLVFLTQSEGRYEFDLGLSLHATAAGRGRAARLALADPASASLHLNYDPEHVRVEGGDSQRPDDGVFLVRWDTVAEAVDPADAAPVAARRTREPTVERAVASVVSTLEGTRLTRVWYQLRLEGRQSMTLDWPEGQTLKRVYVNGAPVEVSASGTAVTLAVSPEQEGGDAGTVELVLSEDHGGYLLSGTLDFEMPAVSWPTRELACSLHLPEVFNYAWSGGSMEAYDGASEAVFAYDVPTPGKVTRWHQELVVTDAPSLRLRYDVDLEGAYYRP
jgi:hypothetical protein